jgi:hypothetical protein
VASHPHGAKGVAKTTPNGGLGVTEPPLNAQGGGRNHPQWVLGVAPWPQGVACTGGGPMGTRGWLSHPLGPKGGGRSHHKFFFLFDFFKFFLKK